MAPLRTLFMGAWLLAGFAAPVSAAPYASASDFVQDLAQRAIVNLTTPGLSDEERELGFRELFREGFAVRGIAKFTLGRYWRSATEAQRQEYLVLFEDVVVDSWAARFTKYAGQRFEIRDESPASAAGDNSVTIVSSLIWASPEAPVRVNWRVAGTGEIFKITDVTVEGVSMANTQRDEFSSLARKSGVAGLIDVLREKSGEQGKLAALVGSQPSIVTASGDPEPASEQEPVPVQTGTLALQLASLRSQDRARIAWERISQRFPKILAGYTLSLERVDLAERGTFHRVRTGSFGSYAAAAAICDELATNRQDCLVVQR